jgi:hypothetical protein
VCSTRGLPCSTLFTIYILDIPSGARIGGQSCKHYDVVLYIIQYRIPIRENKLKFDRRRGVLLGTVFLSCSSYYILLYKLFSFTLSTSYSSYILRIWRILILILIYYLVILLYWYSLLLSNRPRMMTSNWYYYSKKQLLST